MTAAQGAAILNVGMVTAVGTGARQTAAAVRAGISRFRESPICNRRFEPIVMASVADGLLPRFTESPPTGAGFTSGQTRIVRLAAPALAEAMAGTPGPERIPVFLGMPETTSGAVLPEPAPFMARLAALAGVKCDVAGSRVFPSGRAAGLLALREALAWLTAHPGSRVIVGGVDTFVDLHRIGCLDQEGRILGHDVTDGLIPGEGAAFLLLGSWGERDSRKPEPLARVLAVGIGREKGHRYSPEPYRGEGLSEAIGDLFGALAEEGDPIRCVFAGLNGESFGAKEWGVASLRFRPRFAEGLHVEHPVTCFGDTGAALGPLMIGLAAIGLKRGYLEEPCLAWCSADREERAAALLRGAAPWRG